MSTKDVRWPADDVPNEQLGRWSLRHDFQVKSRFLDAIEIRSGRQLLARTQMKDMRKSLNGDLADRYCMEINFSKVKRRVIGVNRLRAARKRHSRRGLATVMQGVLKVRGAGAMRVEAKKSLDHRPREMQGHASVAYRAIRKSPWVMRTPQTRCYQHRTEPYVPPAALCHGVKVQCREEVFDCVHHRVITLGGKLMIPILTGHNQVKSPPKLDRYQ